MPLEDLSHHRLFDRYDFFAGSLPDDAVEEAGEAFDEIWALHPKERHRVRQPGTGQLIPVARWQQAYLKDYVYTGSRNEALALPPPLRCFLEWGREHVDSQLNGLLLNWYDAEHGHYIGQHSDSTKGLIPGAPIVTMSLGAERAFRLSLKGHASVDFPSRHGAVFVVPWETNLHVKHGIPAPRRHERGRRVSVTLRAFG